MNGLIILITALVIYVPNRLHFPESLGITGFNVFNLLLLITLVMMATHRHDPRRAVAIPRPPLVGALLLYYAVLGISLIQAIAGGSTHPWMDITIYKNIVTYSLLYFVAYYGVNDTRQMRFLIGVVVFVFLVASVEAIREGLDYGFSSYSNNHRAAGPFSFDGSNANYAGVFYGIFAPFVLAIAVMPSTFRPRLRFTALGCFLASTIAIFATFSRQSFLILGVTTLLITLRRNPLLGLAVILIIANYALWAPQGVINRVEMTQERNDQGQVVLEDSAESRYVLWNGALDIIHDHPMGIGFNQFQRVIDPYMPSWITARDAQNEYLLITAEAGYQGLMALVLVLGGLFGIGFRLMAVKGNVEARVLGLGFTVACVSVVMGNIYSSTFHSGEVMGNFWVLAGLLARYRHLAREEAAETAAVTRAVPFERARAVYARWQSGPNRRQLRRT